MNVKKRRSNVSCSVVRCTNSYSNTDKTVKFYNFPKKWYERERRKTWIERVRRTYGKNNELWEPKAHNKICSAHFIGNSKSNNPLHPSFHPTIFPAEYKSTEEHSSKLKSDSFQTCFGKSILKSTPTLPVTEHKVTDDPAVPQSVDFSCQTNLNITTDDFIFECTFSHNQNDVCIQTNIPSYVSLKSTSEKGVGNNNNESIECEGFHGFASLKHDFQINSICSVTFVRFLFLIEALGKTHKNCKLSVENQLLMFLMKMKLGLSFSCLSVLFNLHYTSCSRIFVKVLNQLCLKFGSIIFWPSRDAINNTLPDSFKIHYPKCRVIIDCTEVKIQQPKKIDDRLYTYSHYKSTYTAKFLVGVAPNGFISFVSKCYGGRSSDSFITNDCGILNLLEPGDVVLADKGFPGIKCKDDIIMVMPPFVHEGILTYEEVIDTYNIASVRIHVERSIQRIKLYNILSKIPATLLPYLDQIILMCCILTNLQPPTIKGSHNNQDIDIDIDEED